MFEYESPKPKEPTDYTGLKIGAMLAPVYTMPVGIADFLIILGALGAAEKLFSKGSRSADEME
jgi:hypothetical protein